MQWKKLSVLSFIACLSITNAWADNLNPTNSATGANNPPTSGHDQMTVVDENGNLTVKQNTPTSGINTPSATLNVNTQTPEEEARTSSTTNISSPPGNASQ